MEDNGNKRKIDSKKDFLSLDEKGERYLEDSKIIVYKPTNTDKIFKIEIISNAKIKLKDIKTEALNDLRGICKQAGQDPEDHVINYFNLADLLMLVRVDGNLCGFAVAHYVEDNIVHIPVTMINPNYQRMGLATFINTFIFKRFILRKIKKSKFQIWNWLEPIYLIFRTQNPNIYTTLNKRIKVFPSIIDSRDRKVIPTLEEIALAKRCAEKFWPSCEFSPGTFVLKGAYFSNPRLMIDPENIPWSKNKEVNNFFEKELGLTTRGGHALLIMGKISLFDILKSII